LSVLFTRWIVQECSGCSSLCRALSKLSLFAHLIDILIKKWLRICQLQCCPFADPSRPTVNHRVSWCIRPTQCLNGFFHNPAKQVGIYCSCLLQGHTSNECIRTSRKTTERGRHILVPRVKQTFRPCAKRTVGVSGPGKSEPERLWLGKPSSQQNHTHEKTNYSLSTHLDRFMFDSLASRLYGWWSEEVLDIHH
jgi:hypothetical protein